MKLRKSRRARPMIVAAGTLACLFASAPLLVTPVGCGPTRRAEPLVGPIELTEHQQLGRLVFSQHCYQCHPNGAGGVGPAINDKPLPRAAIRTQIRAGVGAMPGFDEEHLSDDQVSAVADYLVALRRQN